MQSDLPQVALIAALGLERKAMRAALTAHGGVLPIRPVVLPVPVGADCTTALERNLDELGNLAMGICFGLAGAILPHVRLNDVIIPERMHSITDGQSIAASPNLLAASRRWASAATTRVVHVAAAVQVDRLYIETDKRRLSIRFPEAGFVDMESASVAELLSSLGIPHLIMRVISDELTTIFPEALQDNRTPGVLPERLRRALSLLDPRQYLAFRRLHGICTQAAATNAAAVVDFLTSLEFGERSI
ncbi:hypothetical protein JW905_13505 [bacterium]|nr:hypothetical protein [candidate division CSSED10-310 bacterium]